MDPIRHPIHPHPLFYLDAPCTAMLGCGACDEDLNGPTFGCERCNVGLHKWCAQQPLVLIRHSLHRQHKLVMFVEDSENKFVCKKCLFPIFGCLRYRCYHCDFNLHLSCAASTLSQFPQKDQGNKSSKKVSTFKHLFHRDHDLILYDQVHEGMRLVDNEEDYVCEWCEKPAFSGKFYACLPCLFFLHEACTFEVPNAIRHPYPDKKSSYVLSYAIGPVNCFGCRGPIKKPRSWVYGLHPCCVILILSRSLKSEYHYDRHSLTYFEKENYRGHFKCSKCREIGLTSDNQNGFYRCVQCDINFHLSCILPSTVEYKYHRCRNPLVLMNPIKDDFYCEYYCDICETKRHPDYCVYGCQDCNSFDAHIECALNQIRPEQLLNPASIIQSLKVKSKFDEVVIDNESQMKHHHHPGHLLSLDDAANVERRYRDCRACGLLVIGQAFFCRTCRDYCLHKECAKLSMSSDQLLESSPLHPLHRLALNYFPYESGKRFICDACGEIKHSGCFNYRCQECEFIMDFKCASLSEPVSQGFKKLESSFHFGIHRHMLFFGNYKNSKRFYCGCCLHPVSGLTYCCLVCDFFLHESCFRRFPSQLQLELPSQSLQSFNITIVDECNLSCFACGLQFRKYDLCYSGDLDLQLQLHPVCARTIALTHSLVYDEAHNHALYYFGRDFQIMFRTIRQHEDLYFEWFECNKCLEYCTRTFYRCLEDKNNFHLECVPIPQVVKSKCHRHHLKLNDSFDEEVYDHDDQYCDVCEERRDPKDHVYICEECVYPVVIGHIKCVLSEMEKIIEATPGASTIPAGCNELDSDNSKIIRDQPEPLKLVIQKEFSQPFEERVYSVDLHPTKPWILVGLHTGNVCIWNYQSKEKEMSFKAPDSLDVRAPYTSAKFIPKKNWILMNVDSQFISIYDYVTSNFVNEFEAHLFNGTSRMFMHPSHPYVLLCRRWDAVIRLWNWERGWDCMQEFTGHRQCELVDVAFNPRDHNTFASASKTGSILIWNVDSPDPIRGFKIRGWSHSIDFLMAGAELYLLTRFEFPRAEAELYLLTRHCSSPRLSIPIEVWDYKTKRCVQTLEGHEDWVTALSVHPEFPIIITCSGHQVRIWDSTNYRLQKTLEIPEIEHIKAISCMKGCKYVAFGGDKGTAVVKITDSEDHNAIDFQLDDEKDEKSNKGKECIGEEII